MFVIVAALLAGFVGGVFGTLVMPTRKQPNPEQVVRARSFELVDEAGRVMSYWGVDKFNNAVLAFGSNWPPTPAGGGVLPGHPRLRLDDPDNQRAVIGVIGDAPFLHLSAADGKTRVRLYLSSYGKPFLLMEDESGPRVALGIDQSDTPGPQDNDWALQFYPERAWLGMHSLKEGGQTYVQGGFSFNQDKVKYPYQQPK
jgi:hypothetical protein